MQQDQKPKIKVLKQNHQIETTAANPHNTFLDKAEAEFLREQKNNDNQLYTKNVQDNIIEWYLRTLGDELYKLAFIDKERYYKIKMFWPSDYDEGFWDVFGQVNDDDKKKQNQAKPELLQLIQNNCSYYLSQFDGFDIEDYFDIIVLPLIVKSQNKVKFLILLNSFTYLIQDNVKNFCLVKDLELFYVKQAEISLENPNNLSILADITNFFLKDYVFRKEVINKQFTIDIKELRRRINPIINEKTRVVLYELYQDI